MNRYKTFAVFLGLTLAAVSGQTAEPTIKYEVNGTNLILTYSGTLLQSTDAVNWTEVKSASSPYKVSLNDKQLFFCSQGGGEVQPIVPGENFSTSLPGGVWLDMNWIKPGTFIMGSPTDELGREDNETQHEVTLTQGYWLGKYEVTQAQYEAVMGTNPSNWEGANLPVENVSWFDAKEFCAKLTASEKAAGRLPEGYEYTLPTEAQWEYACRAGTATALNNGKNLSDKYECPEMDEVGWYAFNSGEYDSNGVWTEKGKTYPVGQKQPNTWGLYDMHGNVWEWCSDWYEEDYYSISPETDPTGPDTGECCVNRGGSWSSWAYWCRSAFRNYYYPSDSYTDSGFRVALVKKVLPLTITINDAKIYDGTPLVSSYTVATVSGLMPGDKLTAGVATTASSDIGTYLYPVDSKITTPFDTAKGIENYTVTYVITQKIVSTPLTITINDAKTYDGTPLVSSYTVAAATGLVLGDKLTAGAATTAGSDIGTYHYPVQSKITTPFDTAKGIKNYMVTYAITQEIRPASESKDMTIPLSDTVNLDMIWIEPGTFTMGSPSDELGRDEDEIQHEVILTKGYWLGKYEVTQEQYEAVMGTNPSYSVGKLRPVEQVSRNEAMEFCEKLTAIEKAAGRLPEGYEYSLPTEAQWEYACRAGTTTALNSGKNLSDMYVCPEMDEVGWYDDNSHGWTSRVGWRKLPNAWGFYDMHGNVFEWCLDWYNSDYYENSPESDPVDLRESNICVRRGGSCARYSAVCRSANRAAFGGGAGKDKETGFRVALVSKDMSVPLSKDVDLRMIWVEPGTFLMGSPEGELGGYTFEVQHEVTLTRGYWLGKYEVTQEQYEAVMGYNPSYFRGDDRKNHPVEYVTWEEAIEFCAKLTAIERETGRLPQGYVYSLPTSAQWEYACRAGTTTALNSGKNLSDKDKCPEMDEVGWYRYNSGEYDADGKDTDNGRHYPVGQKLPNAWGFYDMHGNVEEWCVDKSGEKYTNTAVIDPVTLVGTSSVVIRGGDYRYSTARDCRSAYRTGIDSTYGGAHIGFRVALVREMVIPISNYTDLSMVWIEPGTFIMGSPIEELGRLNREHQHEETLTQGYWMGRYEITQAQYHAVMGTNPSYFTDGQMVEKRMLPVEQVRWVDATNFCAKLTAIEREAGRLPEGYEYTLPTEVQWEYACRAGTTTAFNNGTNIPTVSQVKEELCPNLDEVGWYRYNSGFYDADGNPTINGKTYPVGQKKPNAWGLYDMHGNVYEWCLDKDENWGFMRGGAWNDDASFCRSGRPDFSTITDKSNYVGFRVALVPVK